MAPEVEFVRHAVERPALGDERARLLGDGGVLEVVDDGLRVGELGPDLQKGQFGPWRPGGRGQLPTRGSRLR